MLSLLYLGTTSSVLSPLLFLGMWSQQQILSHPFYPLSFFVIMWLFFFFFNFDVIWQYLRSVVGKCINTTWDLQPIISPVTGTSHMVKSWFTIEPLENRGAKHNLWLCGLSKLSRWEKVMWVKSKVSSKVCQPGIHPESIEWLKKPTKPTLLVVGFAVCNKAHDRFHQGLL